MTTKVLLHHCKHIPILTLVVCCLQSLLLSCKSEDQVEQTLPPITSEMFFHQASPGSEVIIDTGTSGKYSFSGEMQSPDVPRPTIRPELVDFLNKLQGIFKHSIHITAGYRSQQHQIYLWAKWLSEHPEQIAALNEKHATWEAWVNASQALPGCPSLQSKHLTGEAVNFYWETLAFNSDEQRTSLTTQLREAGGTRNYTPNERNQFNISDADNHLFAVTAYPTGEAGDAGNSSGRAYFHVVYQPSAVPAIPNIEDIGTRLAPPEPPPEPEPPSEPEPPPEPEKNRYQRGDIVLIANKGYSYLAEVTTDTKMSDTEVSVQLFAEDLRQEIGDKVSINSVVTKREKPKDGWGSQKILLQYFDGQQWVLSMDATVFEDHYLLPESIMGERKVPLSKVRIPIFQTK